MIYCNQCGTQNEDSALYCKNDGYPLKTVDPNASIEWHGAQFCGQCGHKNRSESIYCMNCGHSLEKIVEKKSISNVMKKMETPNIDFTKTFQMMKQEHFKNALMGVLVAIIVVILSSFILGKLSEQNVLSSLNGLGAGSPMDLYEELVEEAAYYTDIDQDDLNPFSVKNLILNSHFVNQELAVYDREYWESMELNVNFGFVFYILIPMLALFLAGYFVTTRNRNYSVGEKVQISLAIGLLYGLFLAIVTLFAGYSFEMEGVEVSYKFSFVHALFNGFVFGFFFSFLGQYQREQKGQASFIYGKYIYLSSVTFLALFFIVGIVASIGTYLIVTDNVVTKYFFEGAPFIAIVLLLAQFSVWLLNVVTFNTFQVKMTEHGYTNEANFSLFGPSKHPEAKEAFSFLSDHMFLIYLLAILAAAILVWIGKTYLDGELQSSLIFSAIFAILFTFVSVNSSLIVEGNYNGDAGKFVLGFSIIRTYIGIFLFSSIFSFVGAKFLRKN